MQPRPSRWRLTAVLLAALAAAVAAPTGAFAHDGEIISDGSNVIGNITVGPDGYVHATIQNLGDCPPGTTNCWVEIRWYDKGTSPFDCCFSARSSWLKLPTGQDFARPYCDHGDHFWQLYMRLHWLSSGTTTIETWGAYEWVVTVDGSGHYRLMAKSEFNVSIGAGYRGVAGQSYKMNTQTGIDQWSTATNVSESVGWLRTLGC
jgi:hypothetical protein